VHRKLDQYTLAALEDSANSPTEVLLLESVLAFLELCSGVLQTLDAQPMAHTKPLVSRYNNFKTCNTAHTVRYPATCCEEQIRITVGRQ